MFLEISMETFWVAKDPSSAQNTFSAPSNDDIFEAVPGPIGTHYTSASIYAVRWENWVKTALLPYCFNQVLRCYSTFIWGLDELDALS